MHITILDITYRGLWRDNSRWSWGSGFCWRRSNNRSIGRSRSDIGRRGVQCWYRHWVFSISKALNLPAYRIILGDWSIDLRSILRITSCVTHSFESKPMIFIGITTLSNIFSFSNKTTIITAICNSSLCYRLASTLIPSTATADTSIVLTMPVITNPLICIVMITIKIR